MGTTCEFDPCSDECAGCELLADCIDADLYDTPPIDFDAAPIDYAPIKVIVPWNRDRLDRARWE